MRVPVHASQLLRSFAVLLAFLGAGVAFVHVTELPIPGSVVGMLLLTGALASGRLDVRHVEVAADALLSQLGLLFVPPAVAVASYFHVIADEWLALLAATCGSLVAVLWVTARVAQHFEGRGRDRVRLGNEAHD